MADTQYSLADVAKIIGKSEKTISRWIKSGKLPAVKHGTGYLIEEKDIPLKPDASLERQDFIQKQLLSRGSMDPSPTPPALLSRGVDMNTAMEMSSFIAGGQVDMRMQNLDSFNMMLQKHQREVEKIIREQNELAEKYARATYKIGQLEERNRLLEENSQKLEQKMSLLPLPEQWNSSQKEMGELKDNLRRHEDMHQARVTELERHLREVETEKNRIQDELVSERSKGLWARMRDIFK